MHISLEFPASRYFVRSFKPGQVTINDQTIMHSVIIHGDKLITDWIPQSIAEVTLAHLLPLIEHKPDVVILGTGEKQVFIANELLQPFHRAGIGIEIMDSIAACRTYNILAGESRNALLALLLK